MPPVAIVSSSGCGRTTSTETRSNFSPERGWDNAVFSRGGCGASRQFAWARVYQGTPQPPGRRSQRSDLGTRREPYHDGAAGEGLRRCRRAHRPPRVARSAPMKVGVNILNFGPGACADALGRWAGVAEDLGYHSVMISDHVAMTSDVRQRYPEPFYDPFATLGWLAGQIGRASCRERADSV